MKNYFRSFGRVLLTLLLALPLFLASCTEPPTEEPVAEEIEAIPAENTHVLEPTTIERLEDFRDDGTLIFPLDTPEVQELTTGDVIVSEGTGLAPNGFLLKVVSVKEIEGNLAVQTEQAQLEEAFWQAEVSDSHTLTQEDVASESPGVLLSQRPAPAMGEIYIGLNNVVFEDKESGTKITVNGSVTLTPKFDFRLLIIGGELREFRLINKTTQTSHLELSAKMKFEGRDRLLIDRITFRPRLIQVGIVPVVYSPVLEVYVGVDGKVSTGISTSVTHKVVYEAGLVYDGKWNKVNKEPAHTYEFDPLSVTAKLSARVFAAPRLEIRFYGVAGPYVEIEGSLGLNVDLVSDPWWKLFGRVEAVVGIEFEVLGHVIAGYEETVYFHEWIIDQAESPPPPLVGNQIVFASDRYNGNADIYVMNADGSGQTRLTDNQGADCTPAWSPDGRRIIYACERSANYDLCVINADGTDLTYLTESTVDEVYPAWSPDGTRIAFSSGTYGDHDVYVMNADGTDPTRLTDSPGDDGCPAWSPDGRRIVFVSYRDGHEQIYVMNADGSDQINLSNNEANEYWPDWSPDGEQIAFTTDRDGLWEIYVINPDGSGRTRLTNNSISDYWPSWSPDSSRITFVSHPDDHDEIFVMNVDGSGLTNLTDNTWSWDPAWSPVP